MSNRNFKPAVAVQDDAGNWYVIPAELEDDFYAECANADFSGNTDSFDDKYDKYATRGSLNSVQLYADFQIKW
jgi:hypothetical protein